MVIIRMINGGIVIMYKALTIAGSDSGGGAGIQADLKTFASLEVYGTCAITSVTAQNTTGVHGAYDLPPEFVGSQIKAVLSDIGADAVKTGMLANAGIIEIVASLIKEYKIKRLVIDPVMVAKSGDNLLAPEAIEDLKKNLLPLAMIVTPNLDEAEVLTGRKITNDKEMVDAAKEIFDLGIPYVVVKGGHLKGKATDIFFDGQKVYSFTAERLDSICTHGTGCTFSAALTAFLAHGLTVKEAVDKAKKYIINAISHGRPIGEGYGPVHHLASYYQWRD